VSWRDRLSSTQRANTGESPRQRAIGTIDASDIEGLLATEGESRAAEAESNQACVQVQSRDSAQPFLPAYSLLCLKEAEDKSVSSANSSATAIAAPADVFEERAGIVEYDVGVPREWAEGLARLDCLAPSAAIPAHRWRRLIDNAGQFIDRWADRAAALGWDTPSVFGCHLAAP